MHVTKLKYGKIVPNDQITIRAIPLEAQDYEGNEKSALDRGVERCGMSIDKALQIVNTCNHIAEEMGARSTACT